MKLLRDFFRLRTAARLPLFGRPDAVRRSFSITVPEPLLKPSGENVIDMHWDTGPAHGRPVAHWHDHAVSQNASSQTHGHLQLVSSR